MSFLAQVCEEAHGRVADDRAAEDLDALIRRARATPPPPSFAGALAAEGVGVIAEVKRASPSRGHLSDIPDAAELARAYEDGGAVAVSVLTEPRHFKGTLGDLIGVVAAVRIPVLRKDFVVDDYQVWQARAAGAAAVLLIVAALDDEQLTSLMRTVEGAGLDALVETHSAGEIARAVAAHRVSGTSRALVLGVNARDLSSLDIDRAHVARVREAADLPEGALLVAESGVRGPDDVREYAAVGADAVLVGEHVSTASDPTAAVRSLALATTSQPTGDTR